MKLTNWGLLMPLVLVASLAAGAQTSLIAVTVDCSKGQSLNSTLSKLNKNLPVIVYVRARAANLFSSPVLTI
jgi:hypothetical protein